MPMIQKLPKRKQTIWKPTKRPLIQFPWGWIILVFIVWCFVSYEYLHHAPVIVGR